MRGIIHLILLVVTVITLAVPACAQEQAITEPKKYTHKCPDGSEPVGGSPPTSSDAACRRPVVGGYILEGPYVKFHGNGKVMREGEFQRGVKDGKWTTYSRRGRLRQQEEWVNGKRVEKTRFDNRGRPIDETKKKEKKRVEKDNWKRKIITPNTKASAKPKILPFE